MASMSSDCTYYESASERSVLDTPELMDDTQLLMELLDESPYNYVEEDVQDERLRRVIQSLEAEIATFVDNCPTADDDHVLSDLGGARGDSGSACSFDWMVEAESEAAVSSESDTAGWYLEVDDQLVAVEYYGDMGEYINSSSSCYIDNGEECIEHEEYGSLWE